MKQYIISKEIILVHLKKVNKAPVNYDDLVIEKLFLENKILKKANEILKKRAITFHHLLINKKSKSLLPLKTNIKSMIFSLLLI